MPFGVVQLFLAPDRVEEAPDAAVVVAFAGAVGILDDIDPARLPARAAIPVELVQRARPIREVAVVEIGVARMIRDGAPVLRVFHAVNHRAVAARRLAEAAAVVARGQRAEFAVDERNQLAGQVVRIRAQRRRVDVLVAAEAIEAIRKHDDARPHPALVHEAGGALRHVFVERPPADVRQARAGVAHEVPQHRIAPAPPAALAARRAVVVPGGQPHGQLAQRRVVERVVRQDPRLVVEHDKLAGTLQGLLAGHCFVRGRGSESRQCDVAGIVTGCASRRVSATRRSFAASGVVRRQFAQTRPAGARCRRNRSK